MTYITSTQLLLTHMRVGHLIYLHSLREGVGFDEHFYSLLQEGIIHSVIHLVPYT